MSACSAPIRSDVLFWVLQTSQCTDSSTETDQPLWILCDLSNSIHSPSSCVFPGGSRPGTAPLLRAPTHLGGKQTHFPFFLLACHRQHSSTCVKWATKVREEFTEKSVHSLNCLYVDSHVLQILVHLGNFKHMGSLSDCSGGYLYA